MQDLLASLASIIFARLRPFGVAQGVLSQVEGRRAVGLTEKPDSFGQDLRPSSLPPRAEKGALVLAALGGASVWVSLGAVAVLDQRGGRMGALPELWVIAAGAATAVACAWLMRLRTSESWPLSLTALLWLPWLPATVPSAFLVFDGPLESVVWVAAIAGVAIARLSSVRVSGWRRWTTAPWIGALIFLACSIAAAVRLQPFLPGGDEPHYLIITQSLLYDGDLQIENNHERGDFFEYIDTPIRPDYLRRGKNGQIYSVHAPGASALLLPAYAVGGYPAALLFVSLSSALAVVVLWHVGYRLTRSAAAAWAATLAVAFSPTILLHSFTIFPDPLGALLVAVALLVLVRLEVDPESIGPRQLVMAGCSLALLPWLHTRFALLAVAFGLVTFLRMWSSGKDLRTRATAFAAIPVISAVAWFAFFYAIYGTPNPSAPYGGSRQASLEWLPAGVVGLAFDQQFGLVANAPVIALVPWGWFLLWRTRRRLAIEIALIAAPYEAVVASFGMWWGGWSAPARFLTCLLPLTIPLLAAVWVNGSRALRWMFVALCAAGAANVAMRVSADQGLVYNFRDGYDLLLDWASKTVNLPLAFPSLHRLTVEQTLLLGCIWILCGAVAWLVLELILRRPLTAGAGWAMATWVLVVCGFAGLAFSWRAIHAQPITAESSKIDFLHRWNPDRRPLILPLPTRRRVPLESALAEIQVRSSERVRDLPQGPRPQLWLDRMPAGTYELVVDGAAELEGALTVAIGTTSQPSEEWSLTGLHRGDSGLELRVPTRVRSVTVRGDDRANALISHVGLRPEHVEVEGAARNRQALRSARYGKVRAFFLDDDLYMEPAGVWTRGDSVAEVVVAADGGDAARVAVSAGPVASAVEFTVDGVTERLSLAPGERRELELKAGLWRVVTHGRFRPKDYDPATRDARLLGVRLEFP